MRLEASAPAKINLWLEVIGKRSDGYHELSTLMLPIDLCDRIELELRDGAQITLDCDCREVPEDSRNLAWRAGRRYLDACGISTGLHIRLNKSIPVGAGLGGGSTDAAAVLLTLNRAFEHCLSNSQLEKIAVGLGADVPFFLYGHPALATGIGEKLEMVHGLPRYPLLLIKPPFAVSTAWVYGSFKLTRDRSDIKLARILTQPWRLGDFIRNDLETVTLTEYPLLAEIKAWLLERGAVGTLMSGSGPTVFAVFQESGHAEEVETRAKRKWEQCWVARTEVLPASADSCIHTG